MGNKIDIKQESATSVIAINEKSVIGRLTADKDGREMNIDVHPLYKTMEEDIKNDMRQKALELGDSLIAYFPVSRLCETPLKIKTSLPVKYVRV